MLSIRLVIAFSSVLLLSNTYAMHVMSLKQACSDVLQKSSQRINMSEDIDSIKSYHMLLDHPEISWALLAQQHDLPAHNRNILISTFIRNLPLAITAGVDGKLCVWNTDKIEPDLLKSITYHTPIRAALVSTNQEVIFTAGEDAHLCVWSLPELVEIKRIALHEPANAIALSPDQTMIMTGSKTGIVRMLHLPEEVKAALNFTGKPACTQEPMAGPIKEQLVKEIVAFTREPALSIESDMLEDGVIEDGDREKVEDPYQIIHTVNFLPGGELLTAADRIIKIFDHTGFCKKQIGNEADIMTDFFLTMTTSPLGEALVGYSSGILEVKHISSTFEGAHTKDRPTKKRIIADSGLRSIALTHDGRFMLTGTMHLKDEKKNEAHLWLCKPDRSNPTKIRSFKSNKAFVSTVSINGNQTKLLCGHSNGALTLWSIDELARRATSAGAELIITLPSLANEENHIDLSAQPKLVEAYEKLDPLLKHALSQTYPIIHLDPQEAKKCCQ